GCGGRRVFELDAQLAVAGDEKDGGRIDGGDAPRRLDEQAVVLDRRQSPDGRHHVRVWRKVQRVARATAGFGVDCREPLEVEAKWNDAILLAAPNPVVVDELALDARRDRDDAVGDRCKLSLDAREESGSRRGEKAFWAGDVASGQEAV